MSEQSLGQNTKPNTNFVGVLMIPQLLVSLLVLFYVRVETMAVAGCNGTCDTATAVWAENALWIAVAVITLVTLAALIVWRRRGWRTWPITLGGLALTIAVAIVIDQVVLGALSAL